MNRRKPPEIAVALRYDGIGAPRVTATGRAELAQAIRRVADEHDVPLYENVELALALSHMELGEEIPEMLYRAVAEVIAFAYLLSGRVPTPRPRSSTHMDPSGEPGESA
ncbi:MAG: EscU/YscU/HrcU family type III secretion system export apparatus switch protein [Porticoccaceae bacterium]